MSLSDDMKADSQLANETKSEPENRLSLSDQMRIDASGYPTLAPVESTFSKISRAALKPITDRFGAFGSGANSGLATAAGLPVDTAQNILDLGKAAAGSIYGAVSRRAPPSIFEPADRSKIFGSSEYIKNKIEQTEVGRHAFDNYAEAHPNFHAAGTGAGLAIAGGSKLASVPLASLATVGAKAVGDATGSPEMGIAASMALPYGAQAAKQRSVNAYQANLNKIDTVKQQTLQDAQELGFKASPSQTGGSMLARSIEGTAGKLKVGQAMSENNQAAWNKIAVEDLKLPANSQVTPAILQQQRKDAGQHYEEVKKTGTITTDDAYLEALKAIPKKAADAQKDFPNAKIPGASEIQELADGLREPSFSASGAIERVKQLRADARLNLRDDQLDPATRGLGQAQKEGAAALDGIITRHLTYVVKRPDLAANYTNARVTIAKTHMYEDALNEGTGNISLKKIANEDAITGDVKKAANFYSAFPKANQSPETVGGTPPFSPLDLFATAGGIAAGVGAGSAAYGSPTLGGVVGGLAYPAARYLSLKATLSDKKAPTSPKLYSLSSMLAPTLATSDAARNRK